MDGSSQFNKTCLHLEVTKYDTNIENDDNMFETGWDL